MTNRADPWKNLAQHRPISFRPQARSTRFEPWPPPEIPANSRDRDGKWTPPRGEGTLGRTTNSPRALGLIMPLAPGSTSLRDPNRSRRSFGRDVGSETQGARFAVSNSVVPGTFLLRVNRAAGPGVEWSRGCPGAVPPPES